MRIHNAKKNTAAIFLICWVPFFWLNVQNAVCIVLNADSCMVSALLQTLSLQESCLNDSEHLHYCLMLTEFASLPPKLGH